MSGWLLLGLAALVAVLIGLGASPVLPTVRAAMIAVVVLVSAAAAPLPAVGVGAVVLVAAFVVDAAQARRIPVPERAAPAHVVRGVPTPMRVTVSDAPPGRVRIRQPRAAEVTVEPPEADTELDARLVAARRGRHTLGAVALRCTGPLGLAAWYRTLGEGHQITVLPDVPGARKLAAAVRQGRLRDSGDLTRGPLGLGTDFESIRDYLPDDDIRQVNWPATQRVGRPMSNQYRIEQDRIVIGLVDTGRLMAAPIGDRTRLDLALDAFLAVAFVTDEVGDRVGVIAFGNRIRRRVAPRRRGADAIVRAVFDLEPELADPGYDAAFRTVDAGKRALVMIFTDLLDEAAARELLDAIPVLARRHAVMVVSIVDPELDELVDREPADTTQVYRAAAALDLLAPRESLRRRLQRLGTILVEAPPDRLAEAAVRAYLRAKLRSRL